MVMVIVDGESFERLVKEGGGGVVVGVVYEEYDLGGGYGVERLVVVVNCFFVKVE